MKKARELRLSGRSLAEINHELNVPRSTLSNWLKDIVLTEKQMSDLKERIKSKVSRGRLNATLILKSRRIFREKRIFDEAKREFPKLVKNSFFVSGLSLYWAKGSMKNTHFQFTSADLSMISFMIKWARKYLNINESLIKQRKFNDYYRIDILRIDVLRRVVAWQKLLIGYYDDI